MEYKKSMIVIMLAVFLISIASVSASDANDTAIASEDTIPIEIAQSDELSVNDDSQAIGQANDEEKISEGNVGTFSELQMNITATSADTLELDRNYEYDGSFDTSGIKIDKTITIDGKGYTIDAKGKARVFNIQARDVTIKNLIIKNANYNGDGGAVYFAQSGRVINCNFTNNNATDTNSWGGAIRFIGSGTVTNCNFADNQAGAYGGAVYFYRNGNVTNCNFTGNTASQRGGAVYFDNTGNVRNCNFTGNNATTGSAIYFYKYYSTHTLTVSDSTFLNNRANAEALDVVKNDDNITITFTGQNNLLNAIYSRNNAEVTFTNVEYWGANGITTVSATMSGTNRATGQNITVKGVVNGKIINKIKGTDENGEIVLDDSGDYWIIVSHKGDSYYTEVAETVFTNMKLYANVTSVTTTNKTVNITAKSNIPQDVVQGKLLFILPNGDVINATYAKDGIWWAVHTFDDYGEYQVNASYTGLSNVTITNAVISISKASLNLNATYNVSVLDDGFAVNIIVNTDPVVNGILTIKFNGREYPAEVVNGTANFTSKKVYSKTYKTDIFYPESDQYLNSSTTLNAVVKSTKVTLLNTFTYYYYNTDMGSDSKKGISKIKVIDVDGNPIKCGVVTINFMDMYRLKVRTDASGIAEFTKAYKPGTYIVTAQHNNKTTKLGNMVIKSVVNLPKLSKVSKSAKTTTIKITLKGTGPIKGKSVIVTFMKKQYTIKTDKNGVAQFKVTQSMVSKLIAGKTYKIRATYMMDSVAQGIQILK